MMTTGLLALTMAGVNVTTALAVWDFGRKYRYDEQTRTLFIDPGLTLDEAGYICEEMLETVINRLLAVPLLQEQDPAG